MKNTALSVLGKVGIAAGTIGLVAVGLSAIPSQTPPVPASSLVANVVAPVQTTKPAMVSVTAPVSVSAPVGDTPDMVAGQFVSEALANSYLGDKYENIDYTYFLIDGQYFVPQSVADFFGISGTPGSEPFADVVAANAVAE